MSLLDPLLGGSEKPNQLADLPSVLLREAGDGAVVTLDRLDVRLLMVQMPSPSAKIGGAGPV